MKNHDEVMIWLMLTYFMGYLMGGTPGIQWYAYPALAFSVWRTRTLLSRIEGVTS